MSPAMREYFITVGEDGGGEGRPPRMGETLHEFLQKYRLDGGYWGQGCAEDDLRSDPAGLTTGWEGVEVIEALYWDGEPAVWARVLVQSDAKVIDFGGAALCNRYHSPCVDLKDGP